MRHQEGLAAVIFDMDGVIVESEPLWSQAESELLARRNLRFAPELKNRLMGLGSLEAVNTLRKYYRLQEPAAELLEERIQIIARLFRESLQPVPHALELLEAVREEGLRTALASSSPKLLIDMVFEKFGIASLFDCVLSGDQVRRGKPDPDIYLAAARQLQVAAEKCLVIEDAPRGVDAARAAGMRCLAITTTATEWELRRADQVVHGFQGISPASLRQVMQPADG